MNDSFAQCRFVLTQPLFLEGMRCTQRDSMGLTLRRTGLLLGVLWLALAVFGLFNGSGIWYSLLELVVMAAFFAYAALWLPLRRAKRAWQALDAQGKANEERTVTFLEDHLQIECLGQKTDINYAEIEKALTGRELLVLVSRDKTGILLKKDSLTGCTCEELMEQIKKSGGLQA